MAYVRREADGSWTIPIPPSGSPDCGGDDFDRMIYDWAQQKFLEPGERFGKDEHDVDPEILLSCRDLKESLSSHETGIVNLFHDNKRLVLKMTRQEFNRLIEEKIANSIDMVRQLLQDVTASQQTVDAVILIGGSSRVPFIREKLTEVLPVQPLDTMARDIAVALGAASNEKLSLKTDNSTKTGERNVLTINGVEYAFRSQVPIQMNNPPARTLKEFKAWEESLIKYDYAYRKLTHFDWQTLRDKSIPFRLVLPRDIEDSDIQNLQGLTQLQSFNLWGCDQITDAGLAHLQGLTQLQSLHLSRCNQITNAGLAHLQGLTQLQSLHLWECEHITDAGLAHLQGLTQLQSLDLSRCNQITDAGLVYLRGLTQLQSLTLLMCEHITDAGLARLQGLTQLQSLDLSWCEKITDAGLAHLQGLTQLQSLDLSWCEKITDAGLAHLQGLTQLQSLDLSWCEYITDAGLARLQGLTQLQSLEFSGCNITDVGLAHLQGLTQLQSLHLNNCEKVTEQGIQQLKNCLPRLCCHTS